MFKLKVNMIKGLFNKTSKNFSKILENACEETILNTAAASLVAASIALTDFRVVFHKNSEEEDKTVKNSDMPSTDGCIRIFPGGNGATIVALPNAQEALNNSKACKAINSKATSGSEDQIVFIKPHSAVTFVDLHFDTSSKKLKADISCDVQTQEVNKRAVYDFLHAIKTPLPTTPSAKVMTSTALQTSPSPESTETKYASTSKGLPSDGTIEDVLEDNNREWKSKSDNVVDQYQEEIEALRKENDKTWVSKIEDVKKAHDDAAKDLVKNNETWQCQIDDINKQHEGEVKCLTDTNLTWSSKMNDLKLDHKKETDNQVKLWTSKVEDLKKVHDEEVKILSKKTISESDMEDLQKEYKHGIEGIIEQSNKTWTFKIDNLKKSHGQEVQTLKKQVSKLEQQHAALDKEYDELDDTHDALLSRQNELLIQQNKNAEIIQDLNLAVDCKDHALRSNVATTYEFQKENDALKKNNLAFKNKIAGLNSQIKTHIQQLENAQKSNLDMREHLSVSNAKVSHVLDRLLVARERRAEVVSIYRRCEKSWVKCSSRATELEAIFSGDAAANARVLKEKDEQIENLEAQLRSRFICDQALGQLYTVLCNLYNRSVTVSNERLRLGVIILAHMLSLDRGSEMRTMILGQAMRLYGTDDEGGFEELNEAPLCDNCPDSFLKMVVPNTDVCEEEEGDEDEEDDEEEENEEEEEEDEEVGEFEEAGGEENEAGEGEEADGGIGKEVNEGINEEAVDEVNQEADVLANEAANGDTTEEEGEVKEEPKPQEEADPEKANQAANIAEGSSSSDSTHGTDHHDSNDDSSPPVSPPSDFTFTYPCINDKPISNPFASTTSTKEATVEAHRSTPKLSVADLGSTRDAATEEPKEKGELIAAAESAIDQGHLNTKKSESDLNPRPVESPHAADATAVPPTAAKTPPPSSSTSPSTPALNTITKPMKPVSPAKKTTPAVSLPKKPAPVPPQVSPATSSSTGSNKTKQRNQQRKRTKARRAAAQQQEAGDASAL